MIHKYRLKRKRFIYRSIAGLAMLGYAAWHWLIDGSEDLITDRILTFISGVLLGVMLARIVYRHIESPKVRGILMPLTFVVIAGLCFWLADTSVASIAAIVVWLAMAVMLIAVSMVRYCKASEPEEEQ